MYYANKTHSFGYNKYSTNLFLFKLLGFIEILQTSKFFIGYFNMLNVKYQYFKQVPTYILKITSTDKVESDNCMPTAQRTKLKLNFRRDMNCFYTDRIWIDF